MTDSGNGQASDLPVVPGFVIDREIGRGGFGTVYLAHQPQFDRQVAIKIISASGVDDTTVRRFDRECRALGALSGHPNIVAVFDSGTTEDGRLYLVMHYLTGGSLAEKIAGEGRVAPMEGADIGAKLADALAAAHESGVLHRDIKPENILFSRWREPILVDFGIARIAGVEVTKSTSVTASVAYAPIEVLSGKPADARSDVYSLGATLHTMLAGTPAFVRDSDESITPVISRVAMSPPPDLRLHGVPDPLASVIERSLAKEPVERHQTAAELAEELRAVRDARGPVATPPPLSVNPPPPAHPSGTAPPPSPPLPPTVTPEVAATTPPPVYATGPAPIDAISTSGQTPAAFTSGIDPTVTSGPVPEPEKKNMGAVAALAGVGVLAVVALIGVLIMSLGGDDGDGDDETPTPTPEVAIDPGDGTDQTEPGSGADSGGTITTNDEVTAPLLLQTEQFPPGYSSPEESRRQIATAAFICNQVPASVGLAHQGSNRYANPAIMAQMFSFVGVFNVPIEAEEYVDAFKDTNEACQTWPETSAAGGELTGVSFRPSDQPDLGDESVRFSGTLSSADGSTAALFDIIVVRVGRTVGVIVRTGESAQEPLNLAARNLTENLIAFE